MDQVSKFLLRTTFFLKYIIPEFYETGFPKCPEKAPMCDF